MIAPAEVEIEGERISIEVLVRATREAAVEAVLQPAQQLDNLFDRCA